MKRFMFGTVAALLLLATTFVSTSEAGWRRQYRRWYSGYPSYGYYYSPRSYYYNSYSYPYTYRYRYGPGYYNYSYRYNYPSYSYWNNNGYDGFDNSWWW